jgi:hypothetical protein
LARLLACPAQSGLLGGGGGHRGSRTAGSDRPDGSPGCWPTPSTTGLPRVQQPASPEPVLSRHRRTTGDRRRTTRLRCHPPHHTPARTRMKGYCRPPSMPRPRVRPPGTAHASGAGRRTGPPTLSTHPNQSSGTGPPVRQEPPGHDQNHSRFRPSGPGPAPPNCAVSACTTAARSGTHRSSNSATSR